MTWDSVNQIVKGLGFAQAVPADTCLCVFGAVPYAVPNQELFKCSFWRTCVLVLLVSCPHSPRLQSSSSFVDELPFPLSTIIPVFCLRGMWTPLLPAPLVFLHCSCQCLPAVQHRGSLLCANTPAHKVQFSTKSQESSL